MKIGDPVVVVTAFENPQYTVPLVGVIVRLFLFAKIVAAPKASAAVVVTDCALYCPAVFIISATRKSPSIVRDNESVWAVVYSGGFVVTAPMAKFPPCPAVVLAWAKVVGAIIKRPEESSCNAACWPVVNVGKVVLNTPPIRNELVPAVPAPTEPTGLSISCKEVI